MLPRGCLNLATPDSEEVSKIRDSYTAIRSLPFMENDLRELRFLAGNSHLANDATLDDLERVTAQELDIPYLKEHLHYRDAFWLLAIASTGPLLLLLSVAESIFAQI